MSVQRSLFHPFVLLGLISLAVYGLSCTTEASAQERGELIMAGALANPPDGAVPVFKGDSPPAAEAFAQNDPYVKNGLIVEWKVREWTVVIGGE